MGLEWLGSPIASEKKVESPSTVTSTSNWGGLRKLRLWNSNLEMFLVFEDKETETFSKIELLNYPKYGRVSVETHGKNY